MSSTCERLIGLQYSALRGAGRKVVDAVGWVHTVEGMVWGNHHCDVAKLGRWQREAAIEVCLHST